MQLSKRLQMVADSVTKGYLVADVGCDHAYTSIYLARNQISPHIIAMDVNQGPIERAKENIIRYGCKDFIEARKSNGLEKLNCGEADSVIIAGMGGALMVQILEQSLEVTKSLKELILQPQSEIYKVRQFLLEKEFIIIEENMLKEDGKYYVMIKAVPQKLVEEKDVFLLTREEEFHYGRLLLNRQNTILKEFLLWDLDLCEGIAQSLQGNQSSQAEQRRTDIQAKMELIHKGLEYFKKE